MDSTFQKHSLSDLFTHRHTGMFHGRATPQMQCVDNEVRILTWHVALSWHCVQPSHLLGALSTSQDSRVNPSSRFILQDSMVCIVSPQNLHAEALTPSVTTLYFGGN